MNKFEKTTFKPTWRMKLERLEVAEDYALADANEVNNLLLSRELVVALMGLAHQMARRFSYLRGGGQAVADVEQCAMEKYLIATKVEKLAEIIRLRDEGFGQFDGRPFPRTHNEWLDWARRVVATGVVLEGKRSYQDNGAVKVPRLTAKEKQAGIKRAYAEVSHEKFDQLLDGFPDVSWVNEFGGNGEDALLAKEAAARRLQILKDFLWYEYTRKEKQDPGSGRVLFAVLSYEFQSLGDGKYGKKAEVAAYWNVTEKQISNYLQDAPKRFKIFKEQYQDHDFEENPVVRNYSSTPKGWFGKGDMIDE